MRSPAPRTNSVTVALGARSYDIIIGDGIASGLGSWLEPLLNRRRVAVLADARVGELYRPVLQAALTERDIDLDWLSIDSGESSKSWHHLQLAVEWLIEAGTERQDLVITFGGGVIGDLGGFAAAIIRRGVRFVQVPTTLLSQVDSSVGGKTGINSTAGKNLIGAFHQPSLVCCDISFLESLSRRDLLAGYGEVVKYGLLGDEDLFSWLENNGRKLIDGDAASRAEAVRRSCMIKADIVSGDETETGRRSLLNLGHTFGHALETCYGYSDRLLHGEAVAIGCCLAFDLSDRLGLVGAGVAERVRGHFRAMGILTDIGQIPGPAPDTAAVIHHMGQDKKIVDGKPRMVVVRGIGQAYLTDEIDSELVREVVDSSINCR